MISHREAYLLIVNVALSSAMITIALLRNVSSATDDMHVGKLAYPQSPEPVAQMVMPLTNS
jgi:hypothetical protein